MSDGDIPTRNFRSPLERDVTDERPGVLFGLPVPHFFGQLDGTGGHVAHAYGIAGGLTRAGRCVVAISEDDVGLRRRVERVRAIDGGRRTGLGRERWNARFRSAFSEECIAVAPRFAYVRHSVGIMHWMGRLSRVCGDVPLVLEVNSLGRDRSRLFGPVERRALAAAALIVVVSEELRARVLALDVRRTSERCVVIPNGVEVDRFPARRAVTADPMRLRVGYVGALKPDYGLETLIEAVTRKGMEAIELDIVGAGPLRSELERLAASRANVRVCEPVAFEDVPRRLLDFDVLVHATSPRLAFQSPLKLYEAMASGAAVVAAATPGSRSVLDHEESGLLYEPGDASTLAAHLESLLHDPERRVRLGRNARTRAVRDHDWCERVGRLIEAVESTCARA